MFEINGKYTNAKVFTKNIEQEAISQIYGLCNQSFTDGAKIRIMPDVHAGKGCVVGFTASLGNKVIPNLIGVDIGCGMNVTNLGKIEVDLRLFDEIVHNKIPSGKNAHSSAVASFDRLKDLICVDKIHDLRRVLFSIGTLGGGNHFIELNVNDEKNVYLVIHSGSRNLGKQVADLYQEMAVKYCSGAEYTVETKSRLIKWYKETGREKLISGALKKLDEKANNQSATFPSHLSYLEKGQRHEYLHDMKICQEYATANRNTMKSLILREYFGLGYSFGEYNFDGFETVHNYVDFEDNIMRKGAVSAKEGKRLIIPINMRDGSLLCVGKGNEDWNESAPHGAGRLMSRTKAKELLTLEDYKKTMEGVYSTTVNKDTLDEAPDAYKPMAEIIENIQDTVTVEKIIKPIYNFKAGE